MSVSADSKCGQCAMKWSFQLWRDHHPLYSTLWAVRARGRRSKHTHGFAARHQDQDHSRPRQSICSGLLLIHENQTASLHDHYTAVVNLGNLSSIPCVLESKNDPQNAPLMARFPYRSFSVLVNGHQPHLFHPITSLPDCRTAIYPSNGHRLEKILNKRLLAMKLRQATLSSPMSRTWVVHSWRTCQYSYKDFQDLLFCCLFCSFRYRSMQHWFISIDW